ncbi:MAG: hypothetical protein WDZ26_03065 [Nitriliruptoraceae bacterium]
MAAELLRADDPVGLPHLGNTGRLWAAVLDVADQRPHGWTLIGALMVMLHEHEAGVPTRPATLDADAVVDARGATDATRTMSTLLQDQGWELDTAHVDVGGHGYKFIRDGLEFDVISPEGMGERADLTTVPPLRAPQLPGTRQALDRTQRVTVHLDNRVAAIPRPDLLGALVVKACAAAGDHVRGPQRHLEDLARLYQIVGDPAALTPTNKDRQRLRAAPEPTWEVLVDPAGRAAGQGTRRLLTSPPG